MDRQTQFTPKFYQDFQVCKMLLLNLRTFHNEWQPWHKPHQTSVATTTIYTDADFIIKHIYN